MAVSLCRSNPLFESAWYRKTHIPFTHRFQAPQNRYGPRLQYSLEYLSPCSSSSAIGEPRPLTGRPKCGASYGPPPAGFSRHLEISSFQRPSDGVPQSPRRVLPPGFFAAHQAGKSSIGIEVSSDQGRGLEQCCPRLRLAVPSVLAHISAAQKRFSPADLCGKFDVLVPVAVHNVSFLTAYLSDGHGKGWELGAITRASG